MAFPDKLLNPDEEIVVDLRPHWSFFAGPLLRAILALIVLFVVVAVDAPGLIAFVALAVCAVAFAALIRRLVIWQGINMVVTSERMVFRTGVLAKRGIEIPLERINTVFFEQSALERLVGSGDLSVESAGEGGRQDFRNVWRPNRVQQLIYQAREAASAPEPIAQPPAAAHPSPRPGPVPDQRDSIPEQIAQLDDLRVRGIITDAEFSAKKTELLRRM